jgi:hypothetical protein
MHHDRAWHAAAFDALPAELQAHLALFEAAQREGAAATGDVVALTRRYVLEDGASYFPEVGRPVGGLGALTLLLLVGGLVGVLAGIAIRLQGVEWATWIVVLGVGMMLSSLGPLLRGAQRDAVRRSQVERHGLYLLPGALVVWRPDGLWVAPRAAIEGFEGRPRSPTSSMHEQVVHVRDADGAETTERLVVGHHDALRELMIAWLEAPL